MSEEKKEMEEDVKEEMKDESKSEDTSSIESSSTSQNSPMLVGVALLVVLVIIGVIGFLFLGMGGDSDSDDEIKSEYETIEGYSTFENENFKFQYPEDWHLTEGSITIVSKKDVNEMEADEVSPSMNVVDVGSYDGQYDQELCEEIGAQGLEQYKAIFTDPDLVSAQMTTLDYVADVCRLEVNAVESEKNITLVQYAYTNEEAARTYIVTLGTVDGEDLELLEELANTFMPIVE